MKFKEYEMPDGRKAVFEYDENGVGKITLECMDMLMEFINDRKTEPSGYNLKPVEDEPTISKMEQVEDEPQTEIKGSKRLLKGSDEPQTVETMGEDVPMEYFENGGTWTDCAWRRGDV